MIKYNPKEWFGLIFRFHKTDTFRKMLWVLLTYALFTGVFVYVANKLKSVEAFSNAIQVHSLLGFVIGLLLVFRTNSAYDRWWEGRKQWGMLVNNIRNSAIKLSSAVEVPNQEHNNRVYGLLVNFPFVLKEHLREGVKEKDFVYPKGISTSSKQAKHVPNAISKELYQYLNELYHSKKISGEQLISLDAELKSLLDITGACERIKNTPIPYSYNLFIKKFIFAYTMTLPFSLALQFQYWTVGICTFVLYIFGSLELLAEEIEDPFGMDDSDLPTDDLAIKIQGNLQEILEQ